MVPTTITNSWRSALSIHQGQTRRERLAELRVSLKQAQDELAVAQGELAKREAEIQQLERRIRLRLGRFLDELARLDDELEKVREQLQRHRSPDLEALEAGYLPVEEQYRRVWEVPQEAPAAQDPLKQDEKQFKRLYRKLARRYHPDLASDQREREYRNEKMAALNEAYETGSFVEMAALANELDSQSGQPFEAGNVEAELIRILEKELARIRQQHITVQNKLENLHNDPVVQLSLEAKLAQRAGRDLLAEMVVDLRQLIDKKTAERDFLRAQLI